MARKNKAFPWPENNWITFVNVRIEVFCKALEDLVVTEKMKEKEDDISNVLDPILTNVCFMQKIETGTPEREKPKSAITKDDLLLESINKRPDFTCTLHDTYAESVELYKLDLHIECKCIGFNRKSSPSWDLNNNYVKNGINRFDTLSHEYGKNVKDGIMIGYIISSNKLDIQKNINAKLSNKMEKLNFTSRNKVEKVTTKFIREVVEPTNFTMHHIWADYT